jgi:hypothetical protein
VRQLPLVPADSVPLRTLVVSIPLPDQLAATLGTTYTLTARAHRE